MPEYMVGHIVSIMYIYIFTYTYTHVLQVLYVLEVLSNKIEHRIYDDIYIYGCRPKGPCLACSIR